MKLPFINRISELSALNKALSGVDPALLIIYGRRRCGKSRLLQQLDKTQTIYYLSDQSDQSLQRQALAEQISEIFPGFSAGSYQTWKALFDALGAQARTRASTPTSLILDEFPYLVSEAPELPSILQKIIDTDSLGMHLVLSGSSQRMMKSLVLDDTSPLYGRAREILKIRPIKPGWISNALNVQGLQAIESYSLWGGIPRYWELAAEFKDHSTAIRELVLNRDGVLHSEPRRLLLDDMRTDTQPHSVLAVIGLGVHRLSEISARLQKPAINLLKPLETLIDLGLVRREIPFGELEKNSKRSLYSIADPFLRFWYRYVCPHLSSCEQELYDQALEKWETTRNQFFGETWEELARESVPYLSVNGMRFSQASRWWGKDSFGTLHEIDIVAESIDGTTVLLGEAKWGYHECTPLCERLLALAKYLPFIKNRKVVTASWIGTRGDKVEGHTVFSPEDVLLVLR